MSNLIDRQAAIDALAKLVPYAICDQSTEAYTDGLTDAYRLIYQLPPAQPERKNGHWIESHEHVYMSNVVKEWTNWYCSECDAPNDKPTDFCPNCGADMRGEQGEGKWINVYDRGVAYKRCSECGACVEDTFFANDYEVNFCPNCGADMREKPRLHITESEEDKDGRGR